MKIKKIREVKTPERSTEFAAGIDFYIPEKPEAVIFPPNESGPAILVPSQSVVIPSGIIAKIPKGHALIAVNRSSVALKGLQVGACLIDEDYQGEIHLHITNIGDQVVELYPNTKILQCVLVPVAYEKIELIEENEELFETETSRGDKGLGSTGE